MEFSVDGSVRLWAAATMFDPWRLLFFPMVFVVGADVVRSDKFGLVVLHPVLGFASSTSVDFGLKTAELFFFFTGVDVVDGLSSTSCVST